MVVVVSSCVSSVFSSIVSCHITASKHLSFTRPHTTSTCPQPQPHTPLSTQAPSPPRHSHSALSAVAFCEDGHLSGHLQGLLYGSTTSPSFDCYLELGRRGYLIRRLA
ncbi:hypothetical protein T439DRAFT_252789 [Meredithblackwellia eburnea MCA 4105]